MATEHNTPEANMSEHEAPTAHHSLAALARLVAKLHPRHGGAAMPLEAEDWDAVDTVCNTLAVLLRGDPRRWALPEGRPRSVYGVLSEASVIAYHWEKLLKERGHCEPCEGTGEVTGEPDPPDFKMCPVETCPECEGTGLGK
jgi:hypothetical protein